MNDTVTPIRSGPMPSPKSHARMGQMLLDAGKLNFEEVELVLRMQKSTGLRFGDAAMHLKLLAEQDVREVLARQFSYHYVNAKDSRLSPELVVAYQPFGKQAESFRAIRSQLMLHWFGNGQRALAIASLHPKDGVSYMAANLAVTFSQLGQQTVLVDANLRAPRQRRIFGIDERLGLSDMLARRCPHDSISRIDKFSGLSVLPAGTQVPNPQELLSSNSLTTVHESLVMRHEIVLYDVPALSECADALAIAARAGGVLLIVRRDKTGLHELKTQSERLRRCGAEIVGTVMGVF